jgi:hypothetical protein
MGITIHYQGRLRSEQELELVLDLVRDAARSAGWALKDVNHAHGTLERVLNEAEQNYEGPVRGVVVQPHTDSEPFHVLFGDDLVMQDYCKTQFSSVETHVAIIRLLQRVAPHFDPLVVEDEGEFWETQDQAHLRDLWNGFDATLCRLVEENPDARIKIRLPSGRILDALG